MRIGDPWEERAGPDQLLAQDSWARSPGATNIQGCPPKDIYDRTGSDHGPISKRRFEGKFKREFKGNSKRKLKGYLKRKFKGNSKRKFKGNKKRNFKGNLIRGTKWRLF